MTIDLKKTYRTRGGEAVRIYAVDGGYTGTNVHGAIQMDEGEWMSCTWTGSGYFGRSFDSALVGPENDLIEVTLADELTPQIPWSALRSEIKWVAVDDQGSWVATVSDEKPEPTERRGWKCTPGDRWISLDFVAMPAVAPARWRETLCKRPVRPGKTSGAAHRDTDPPGRALRGSGEWRSRTRADRARGDIAVSGRAV